MNNKIYKHIIKITSSSNILKEIEEIEKLYQNDMTLIIDNDIYYFEDKDNNIVKFDSEQEFINQFRKHKGAIRLYRKLLSTEQSLIRDCIKLYDKNLDKALQIYKTGIGFDNTDDPNNVINEEIIRTRFYPIAYCEYIVYMLDDNIIYHNYNKDEIFSYDDNNKIQGIFALSRIDKAIWNKYIPSNVKGNEDYLWMVAHKNMIEELLSRRY